MKILSASQTRKVDALTITDQNITSLDLMERAASACTKRLFELLKPEHTVHVYCGAGNNGGDGLVIARLLDQNNFSCKVFLIKFRDHLSPDTDANLKRLKKETKITVIEVPDEEHLPKEDLSGCVAVDAILGTGAKPVKQGLIKEVINFINKTYRKVISIDMPSGLLADQEQLSEAVVQSHLTLSFQYPKLAFMLPENGRFVQHFEIIDIGLSEEAIEAQQTNHYFLTAADIQTLIRPRAKFSHKGTFGKALLLAGSRGKTGAAILAAEACLRSGAGLLTVHTIADTLSALAVRLPEAMSSEDEHSEYITEVKNPERFAAIGFGPGVGTETDTSNVLKKILQYGVQKLVIDADGLNILSENKTWLEFLPASCILTPHPKEFERLTEKADDDYHRLSMLKEFAARHNCIVVLKGAHTCVAMPDGNLFFNSTGNPGMAKGGSGDVLTGIILGLLSSGYNPPQSALIGVYLHGLAADLCAQNMGTESMLASDIIAGLPYAFKKLHS